MENAPGCRGRSPHSQLTTDDRPLTADLVIVPPVVVPVVMMILPVAVIFSVIIMVIPVIPIIAVAVTIVVVVTVVATVAFVVIVAVPLPLTIVDEVAAAALVHHHLAKYGATERPAVEPLPVGVNGNHPIAVAPPPAVSALDPLNDHDLGAHHSAGAIRERGVGTALHDHRTLHCGLRRQRRCRQNQRQAGTPTQRDTALHNGLKVLGNGRSGC